MSVKSKSGTIAVAPPTPDKIESSVTSGGFVLNTSRTKTVQLKLVMGFQSAQGDLYPPGSSVLVPGDAPFRPWAKKLYEFDGQPFVLVPEADVLGYVTGDEK